MPLANPHDTIGANLSLTNSREEANQTNGNTNSEKHSAVSSEVLAQPHKECHETVETLGCRHR